jgi:hypothetical protein
MGRSRAAARGPEGSIEERLRRRTSQSSIVLALAGAALAAGCAAGPRRPLFDISPAKPQPDRDQPALRVARSNTVQVVLQKPTRPRSSDSEMIAPVASPSATREEIDQLVQKLHGSTGADRLRAAERLVKLGSVSPQDLESALDEARFEADLLTEAETRLRDGAAASDAARIGALGTERKRPSAAPWVEEKYRLALDRYLTRDYLGCLGAIDAILSLEPSPAARPKLDRLRRRARERLVAETVVATTIAPERVLLGKDELLRAKVVLENKSHDRLVLRAGPNAPLGQVVVDYEELLPDGTRTMRRSTRLVAADRELDLQPGEKIELPVDLPTEHGEKPPHVVGRYRLSGRLRPYSVLAGEEPVPYFLPLFEVFVFVIDPEDQVAMPDARDPKAAFEKALGEAREAKGPDADAASRRVFGAALVWASGDRDAALGALVAALEPAVGELSRTLAACLARATGEPGSFSKEEWLAWWRTASSRPRAAKHANDPPLHEGPQDDEDRPADGPGRGR